MASIQQAQLWLQQGRADRAEQALREALSEDPNNPRAFGFLALCLCDLEREQEAAEMAKQAIALAPDWFLGHYALAVSYVNRGMVQEARSAIDETLRLTPNNPDAWSVLAQIHLVDRKWPEAAEAADRGLALDPEHVNCSNTRTTALTNMGDKRRSLESIQSTLARDPENPQTHTVAGWASLQRGDMKSAETHFTEALRIDPSLENARDGLLEVIKAKNVLYRTMLRFFMWMGRQTKSTTWLIVIGIWIVPRGLRAIADKNPALAPLLYPLIYLVIGFVYLTWVIDPIFDALLFLHPLGRHALAPKKRKQAITVVITLTLALLCFIGSLAGLWWAPLYAVVLLLLVIPIKVAFSAAAHRRSLAYGILFALGTLGLSAATLFVISAAATESASISANLDGKATTLAGALFGAYALGVLLLSVVSVRWSLDPREEWR